MNALSIPASKSDYRADVDGLRALAVLLVLIFHFRLIDGIGDAGFIGVDVFFVISGYLITGIVVGQLDSRRFSFRTFYTRRLRRLAPALQATLLLTVLASWFLLMPLDFAELVRQMLASQWYVANAYYWQNVNYFGLSADRTVLLHMWSLAVEEQFYLFFPMALWALHRWAGRWLLVSLMLGLLASFSLNLWLIGTKPTFAFYMLPTRAWELLAGACLTLAPAATAREKSLKEVLGWGGLLAIAAALLIHRPGISVPGWFAVLPVLGAVALIRAGTLQSTSSANRLLGWGPWVYVGRISYPAYLVHWPVNVLATLTWGPEGYTLPWRWAMFALSLLLAVAVFHGVEQPVRHNRHLGNRPVLGTYAALLLASVLLLIWSQHSHGIPSRFSPAVVAWANQVEDRPPALEACEFRRRNTLNTSADCQIGANDVAPTWMIYGDSHAWAGYPAFDAWLRQRGESAIFGFRHACPPVVGVHLPRDQGACANFNESVMQFLAASPHIRSVALVSTWLQASEGVLTGSAGELPTMAGSLAIFDRQLGVTLDRLAALNKRVLVWDPVPGARDSVPQAMARGVLRGHSAEPTLRFSLVEHHERYAFFEKALATRPGKVWIRFSPADVLCGSGTCKVVDGENALYHDNGHLSSRSAPLWAAELAARVPR